LYGYGTSLIVSKGTIVAVFENKLLRKIFGPRIEEWRIETERKLPNLYRSPCSFIVVKGVTMGEVVALIAQSV